MKISRAHLFVVQCFVTGFWTIFTFFTSMFTKSEFRGTFGGFGEITIFSPTAAYLICPLALFTQLYNIRVWISSSKRTKGVWYWYIFLKGFLMVGLISISIYCLQEASDRAYYESELQKNMDSYDVHINYTKAWDVLQKKFNCCGVNNYSDWQATGFGKFILAVPRSCCLTHLRKRHDCGMNMLPSHPNATMYINTEGCFPTLFRRANVSLLLLGFVLLSFGIYHLITLVLSFGKVAGAVTGIE